MKVRFLNPVEQVTGSCYWLKDEQHDVEFLVDCGMMQGEIGDRDWNIRPFEFNPAKLKCVFLTHTHIDHCGLLPRLAKEGFRGAVYCTRESAELAKISLADAARQPGASYSQDDVERLAFHEPEGQLFGKLHPFGKDLFFAWYRTAHIIGAVSTQIRWGPPPAEGLPSIQRGITFSGDLGCNAEEKEYQPLQRHRMRPIPADYAVIESTYGATVRSAEDQDFHARSARLKGVVDRALFDRKGQLLIPCFAIDRTQSVLFDLHYLFRSDPDRYRNVPVYLNAPMASHVNAIYSEAMRRKEFTKSKGLKSLWMNKRLFEWLDIPATTEGEARLEAYLANMLSSPTENSPFRTDPHTKEIQWRERRLPEVIYTTYPKPVTRLINAYEPYTPSIVVTGGGMCEGGMILAYLEAMLRRESTTLLFTGYLPPTTLGGKIRQYSRLQPEERQRASEHLEWPDLDPRKPLHRLPLSEVRANVDVMTGYSGHADQHGLLDWLFSSYRDRLKLAGRTIFITHGVEHARRGLQAAIEAKSAEWGRLYPEQHPGVTVHLPTKRNGWFDLDAGEWLPEESAPSTQLAERIDAIERRLSALEEILRRIESKLPAANE